MGTVVVFGSSQHCATFIVVVVIWHSDKTPYSVSTDTDFVK
jgi:hypothetical protein